MIKEINIPKEVREIGDSAYAETAIEKIVIPDSVTSLGTGVFALCDSVKEAIIGKGITKIPVKTFYKNLSLEKISYSGKITEIGDSAFEGSALNEIVIPDTVVSFGKGAFASCASAVKAFVGKRITEIPDNTFYNCASLKTVNGLSKIEAIGASAFQGSRIEIIDVSDSVTYLGAKAFADCSSALTLKVGNGLKVIPDEAFSGTTSLKSASISSPVTAIGDRAFYGSGLESIALPDTAVSLGKESFSSCKNLVSVKIYEGLKEIGKSAFENNISLSKIAVPDTVETLGEGVFSGCISLTEAYLSKNCTKIDNNTFLNCESLKEIEIPVLCESIGEYAFNGCRSLEKAVFNNGLKSIATGAFGGCKKLKSIMLPDSTSIIGNAAFIDCTSLESFSFCAKTSAKFLGVYFGNSSSEGMVPITQSDLSGNKNYFSLPATLSDVTVRGNLIQCQLRGCKTIKNLTVISDSETIPESFAYNCPSLKTLSVEGTTEMIMQNAFSFCTALSTVTLGDSVKYVAKNAFSNTLWEASLTEEFAVTEKGVLIKYNGDGENITFPSNVKYIGGAFDGNQKIKSVVIPGTVKGIGAYAFRNTKLLTDITLMDGIEELGKNSFYGALSISSIIIPGSVKKIDDFAFCICQKLTTVDMKNGVKEIGSAVFKSCSNLSSVKLSETLETIGNYAFSRDTALKELKIPDSVKTIGEAALYQCSNIKSLYLPFVGRSGNENELSAATHFGYIFGYNSKAYSSYQFGPKDTDVCKFSIPTVSKVEISGGKIYSYAFCGVKGLRYITYSANPKTIPNYAFYQCENLTSVTEFAVDSKNKYFAVKDGILYNKDFTVLYKCPECYSGAFTAPETVIVVKGLAFANCVELAEMNIPNKNAVVGANVIYGCSKITKLTVPLSDDHALFSYYGKNIEHADKVRQVLKELVVTRETSIDIKDDITKFVNLKSLIYDCEVDGGGVGSGAFLRMRIDKTVLPKGLTYINKQAFSEGDFDSIMLPEGISFIGEYAFYNSVIDDITIPDTVAQISKKAFSHCTMPKDTKMPSSLKDVGEDAFAYTKLNSLKFGDCLETVGSRAFYFTQANDISLPDSLKSIGNEAFSANQLTEVTLPSSLESIGEDAFRGSRIETLIINCGAALFDN